MNDKVIWGLFIDAFVTLWCILSRCDGILVTTKYGDVLGSTRHLQQAHGSITAVDRFLGIPYARPPIGSLRFKATLSPRPWKPEIYNATFYRNVCLQKRYDYFLNSIREVWPQFSWEDNSSEDCLYLNVFAPENNSSISYPVMIFIHGGSYILGTSARPQTPGDVLPLWGVVLVTIQYRLGPFGFMTSGDSAAPGNFGMLDQVMAMEWVKENIGGFGGDPDKVTIFGVSAGGSSVGLHLLSPLSKGLFHQAIAESGVELSPFAFLPLDKAVESTKSVARKLGCVTADSSVMVECLRSKEAGSILELYESRQSAPVVDNKFLTDTPLKLRKAGKFQRLPFIAGFNSQDGAHNVLHNSSSVVNFAVFKKAIQTFVKKEAPFVEKLGLIADAIEFQYTPWAQAPRVNPLTLYNRLVDMKTDFYITAPTVASLSMHSQFCPTYMYEFSHKSDLSKYIGVRHGDNTAYDFGLPLLNSSSQPFSAADQNVSRFLMTVYTNFAKYGIPTPQAENGIIWNEFNATHQSYLRIQTRPEVALDFEPQRMAFWNTYFHELIAFSENCSKECTSGCETNSGVRAVEREGSVFCCITMVIWCLSHTGLLNVLHK